MLRSLMCATAVLLAPTFASAREPTEVRFDADGLSAFRAGGRELLKSGRPRLTWYHLESGDRRQPAGSYVPQSVYDESTRRLKQSWEVGELACAYRVEHDQLAIRVTFTNRLDQALSFVQISVMTITFPATPKGPGWHEAMHTTSDGIDEAPAVLADFGESTLCVVGTSRPGEMRLQLYSNYDPDRQVYDLLAGTISRSSADFIHADQPLIRPGEAVEFEIVLRAGRANGTLSDLAGDLLSQYSEQYTSVLKWDDRRPIAQLVIGNSDLKHHSATNPRGWFGDPKLDALSPYGKVAFRKRALDWAGRSVAECRARGAQGMILWDIEGQEFQPLVYVGDPRMLPKLAPEFDTLADQFFKRFSDAGLKTGVCIRPSRIVSNWDPDPKLPWRHSHMAFDPVEEMADKIDYAKKRWGCTLFYIDTNVTWAFTGEKEKNGKEKITSWTMRADMMRRLAERHHDVLIIPEFQYTGYYSHVSGYRELRGGQASTPEHVRAAYPDAFSVINVADGKIKQRSAELAAAVRRGDILMFRGWTSGDENDRVLWIYRNARN